MGPSLKISQHKIMGLEFLRGLCAVFVAVSHCLYWAQIVVLPSLWVPSVAVFFVISGAVLYCNYHDLPPLTIFLARRFARLAPLYFLCLVITVAGKKLHPGSSFITDASMLFGFFGNNCSVYGCWTLGVEFALYTLFPVFLAFMSSMRLALLTALALFILRVAHFEHDIGDDSGLNLYAQPGSFMLLFFGGMALAKWLKEPNRWLTTAVGFTSAVVLFWPRQQITGVSGAINAILPIVITACFLNADFIFSKIKTISRFLGEISYGLYLLHPIVWSALHDLLKLDAFISVILTPPLAASAAWFILHYYEIPIKKLIVRSVKTSAGTSG